MGAPSVLHDSSYPFSHFISAKTPYCEDSSYGPLFPLSGYVGLFEGSNLTVSDWRQLKGSNLDAMTTRNLDATTTRMMSNGGIENTRMSKISFRTESVVEILDDGFKWRKYGKKAVKNSPNPRNYYKCSSVGCGVKKRVERDNADTRFVITTYEGVHNHASPMGQAYTPQPSAWISPNLWS